MQEPLENPESMKAARALVSVVDAGFAAQPFSSAEEFLAFDCIDQTRCLILDVAMPGMSGLSAEHSA